MQQDLKGVLDESPKITTLAKGFASATGPVFSRRGYLLFSDSDARKIMKWQGGAVSVFREPVEFPKGLTFDHQGRLLACAKSRLIRIEKNGAVTVLAGKAPVRDPLDVVFAIDDNVYFCDGAAVYQVKRDAGAVVASRECERPVGVALSPNQQSLYVADGGRNNIRNFVIKPDGTLAKGRVFAEVSEGHLGGLKTDEAGRLWIASAAGVLVFSSNGERVGSIKVPEPPNNLNWAEGFRNLIVTSGSSIYRVEARASGTRTY